MDISVSSFLGVAIRGTDIGDFSASAGGMVGISQDFNPGQPFGKALRSMVCWGLYKVARDTPRVRYPSSLRIAGRARR